MPSVTCYKPSLFVAAAFLGAGMFPGSVASHDWYPRDCCSGYDCYAIDNSEVEATDEGWLIMRTGEVVEYGQSRRPSERKSEDGGFHRCSVGGNPDARTLCLFVPRMAS